MPGSLGGVTGGLGPGKKPEQPYLQISPSSLHVAGREMGSSGQPAALGNHVTEKVKPQGPLAHVGEMKKKGYKAV